MATDDETMVRGRTAMQRPSPGEIGDDPGSAKPRGGEPIGGASLFRRTGPPKVEPAAGDAVEPESFDPEDTDYKAFGRAGNRTVPSLRLILKDGTEYGLQYGHLDTAYPGGCEFIPSAPGKGNVIKLRFAGQASAFLVVMEGIRLRSGWEQLMAHQTPWVHELPSEVNFQGGTDPVITSITFQAAPAIIAVSVARNER